ncbi:hypothetical protein ACIP46_00945 [Streptomyces lavendulae]
MVQDPHAEPDFAFLADRPAPAPAAHHPTVVERFAGPPPAPRRRPPW